MSQVLLHNKESGKNFFAVGLQNEDSGYEVRNQFFKGCVGSKSISFIRGKNPEQGGIHFFEGMMGFAAAERLLKTCQMMKEEFFLLMPAKAL